MALALAVQVGYVVTNDQRTTTIWGKMLITGTGNYPVGGFALDSVLLAIPEATGAIINVQADSNANIPSGYIWQRNPITGKLMGLQVPPSGSLTTAAPLQQIPSSVDQNTLTNEVIGFEATYKRNSQ
jgi:hypothetical protein